MKVNANQRMKNLLPTGIEGLVAGLPRGLQTIVDLGVEERNGCFLSRALLKKSQAVAESDFPDRTGYECFVNHLHADDFVDGDYVRVAYAFLCQMGELLKRAAPGCSFRGIISTDEAGCSARFHRIRHQEAWCSGDLESFKEEGVCIIDL